MKVTPHHEPGMNCGLMISAVGGLQSWMTMDPPSLSRLRASCISRNEVSYSCQGSTNMMS